MEESFVDRVYWSINGFLLPQFTVAGVENIFSKGGIGIELYEQASDAYARICDRLGVRDEDPDQDIIVRSLEEIEKEISYRMYQYGAQFGMREL